MGESSYPYCGRDLFSEPESYTYAACSNHDYLDSWRSYRQQSRQRLLERAAEEHPGEDPEPDSASTASGQSLRELLRSVHADMSSGRLDAAGGGHKLRPFVAKYEVFKRLFSHYEPSTTSVRRTAQATLADLDTYLWFASCLASIARAGDSLKHLSTLIKLCDALCSLPAGAYTPQEAARATEILRQEEELVQEQEVRLVGA
jgi:hypothetical protein